MVLTGLTLVCCITDGLASPCVSLELSSGVVALYLGQLRRMDGAAPLDWSDSRISETIL